MKSIIERLKEGVVLGDGGYLIELERRGYVDSHQPATPQLALEQPEALQQLHTEFLCAGSQVLQALTFFGTREKLTRAGYGPKTESINFTAVRLAKEIAGHEALVAGSVSRTQLFEREGAKHARDLFTEQVRLLKAAGVDFLILETFFRLDEMLIALDCAQASGLPIIATMSFCPSVTTSADGHTPAQCARALQEHGAIAVGVNCEQEPRRMLPLLREMRSAVTVPLAAQPAAFRTTDEHPCLTRQPAFPDDLESIQVSRREFLEFAKMSKNEGIGFIGGCCGCNAAYIRALARGLNASSGS